MNDVRRLGLTKRVLVALAVTGVVFGIATAVQAGTTPEPKKVTHWIGTHLVSNKDANFNLAACSAAPCTSHHTVAVTCPDDERLLSGGVTNVGESNGPFGNGGDIEVHQSYPVINQYGQTWAVDLTSIRGATHVDATAWAICAKVRVGE